MKSQTQKAISILKEQIKKVENANFDFDSWKVQCISLIEFFLGENSEEYKSLNRPTASYDANYGPESEIEARNRSRIRSVCNVLETAIDTINIKGIYKKPRRNSLSTISEGWLIFITSLIISVMVGLFYIGYWCGQRGLLTNAPLIPQHKTQTTTNNTNDSTYINR